jgi:hypothetical protein
MSAPQIQKPKMPASQNTARFQAFPAATSLGREQSAQAVEGEKPVQQPPIEMRHEARNKEEVKRTISGHVVRDAGRSALRVPGFRLRDRIPLGIPHEHIKQVRRLANGRECRER